MHKDISSIEEEFMQKTYGSKEIFTRCILIPFIFNFIIEIISQL